MSPDGEPGLVTTPADLAGVDSNHPLALLQWTARFCEAPEMLPAFASWVRLLWPACPYSDEALLERLSLAHDLLGLMLGVRS